MDPEFDKDAIKTAVIDIALYCLKSAGAACKSHLPRIVESLEYVSCKANPNLWLKPEIRPEDGVKYYSYLLCYGDNVLYTHHNANTVLPQLQTSNVQD